MKILKLELCNYIGIYNGIGREYINIDFAKSTHRIIAIEGHNGSGKSTILKALNPFPDDSSNFIPGKKASKSISYLHNGVVYLIVYVHEVKEDGTRETTKGQIYKNGMILNPSWNVTNCKELIYSIFNLDPNFITLSQLSSDDRGLADKKPAERKRFVNSILSNITVYNNMYKILTKKSIALKSMITSINSKIGSLDNKESLIASLASMDKQLTYLSTRRDAINISLGSNLAKIEELDKDKNIIDRYNEIKSDIEKMQLTALSTKRSIDPSINENDYEKYANKYNDIKNSYTQDISTNNEIISINNKKYRDIVEFKLLKETEKLRMAEVGVDSIKTCSVDVISYKDMQKQSLEKMAEVNDFLEKSGFSTISDKENDSWNEVSIQDLNYAIDKFKRILMDECSPYIHFSIHYEDNFDNNICYVISNPDFSYKANSFRKKAETELASISAKINTNESIIILMNQYLDDIKILENKPKDCMITSCSFICNALKSKSNLDRIANGLSYDDAIKNYQDSIEKLKTDAKELESRVQCFNDLENIRNYLMDRYKELTYIYENSFLPVIYKKIPNKNSYLYIEKELKSLHFDSLGQFIFYINNTHASNDSMVTGGIDFLNEVSNNLTIYRRAKETNDRVSLELSKLGNKSISLEAKEKELSIYQDKVNELTTELEDIKNDTKERTKVVLDLKNKLGVMTQSFYSINSYIDTMKTINELNESKATLEGSAKKIKDLETAIENNKKLLSDVSDRYNTLSVERNKVAHALTLIDSYSKELAEYNIEYDKIEKVKYYTSPTTGIQTIFMGIYMNNIIFTANQLLELMFKGVYKLLPFVINESEFRIPCSGEGYTNDDISSMSTSQICMISMILSFSILHYASNDYNIIKLDEIDGGLDTDNRLQFIKLLEQLMDILSCEQCFMISHNSELSSDNIDVILLSPDYDNGSLNIVFKL